MNSDFETYAKYYADKCKKCKGQRRVKDDNGRWVMCGCQDIARIKYRFEQIDIFPPKLKYKNWKDWNGLILDDNDNAISSLNAASAMEARAKAFAYCFGGIELSLCEDRRANSKILKRLKDGTGLTIVGERGTGRSFLGSLVVREIAIACAEFDKLLSFKWIQFAELIDASRWSGFRDFAGGKQIDYDFIRNTVSKDFLIIDGVDDISRGHTGPPDVIVLDNFFQDRINKHKPIIYIVSKSFYAQCHDSRYNYEVSRKMGSGFLDSILSSRNTVINLIKARESDRV